MDRRSANEGSIYKRKRDGLWVAQYLVDTPDGRTKRKYIYGKKRKEVAEIMKERGEGLLLDAGNLIVAEFLADWLESEKESVRESTHSRREQVLRLHVYPNIGHIRLSKLNALHVQRLYTRKIDEGLSPGTVRLIHANLSKALQKAVRWRLVGLNVARSATAPKNNTEEVKPLTRAEVKRLLDAARGDRFEALYVLALTCGLRRGEALGLKYEELLWKAWEDVREKVQLQEGTYLHQLRHTCATLPLQENVHPKLVTSLLGHSTIKQTLDTYSHVLDNMLGSAADGMDEALGCFPMSTCCLIVPEGARTRIEAVFGDV